MRVLLVEDEPHAAHVLAKGLREQTYAVDLAADGDSAIFQVGITDYDAVILDVMLPVRDGFAVCRTIRESGCAVPILMVTARDAVEARIEGLDSGADDYLVKPFAYEELLARVRALLRRRAPRARRTLRYADVVMDLATREVRRADELIPTTAKEFDLLQHFMRNPGQVLRREQLLDAVWGFDFGASSNVVDVYVGYVRQKLEQGGRPRLLQTVRGVGYILKEE